jgi:hypothetical protein
VPFCPKPSVEQLFMTSSYFLVTHRALPDLQRTKPLLFCDVVGTEVGIPLVRLSPLPSWTRGSWSTSRRSPRAFIGPGARLLDFLFAGPHTGDATQEEEMELMHRRCCGLDVHKGTAVACLRLVADGKVTTEVRTFQTTTADLLRLSEWLAANECTLAMKATGVAHLG